MKISIITASYNYAQYIEEAIDSVINQSYQDWELIIVDDGSSDNSAEIIKSYCAKDSRIKLFQHDKGANKGLKETLLLGLEKATGKWIAFLESDDFFEPDNLTEKVKIIERHGNLGLVFNKVRFLSEFKKKEQKRFEKVQEKLSKKDFPRNMFYDFYINNMILTFSCVMVRRDALNPSFFETPVDKLLDWWLWIHLAYENEFYYIEKELTSWRLHDKSYIQERKKSFLQLVQVQAYLDIFKRNKSIKLFGFIVYSTIILFFVRSLRFFRKII